MRILSEVISGINWLLSLIPSMASALTDDNYLTFGTSDDAEFTFTGLAGKITLVSDQDVAIGLDEATTDRSFTVPASTVITLNNAVKVLYAKGATKAGTLKILSENYNVGKSDQQLMDEAYVRK